MAFLIRPATAADAAFLFMLRTDPDVVATSNTEAPLDLEQHLIWLEALVTRDDRILFIIEIGPGPVALSVGMCRLDICDYGRYAEVSIALVKALRGKGLGTAVLREVARRATEKYRLGWLEAVIKESNTASRRAFLNAGYTVEEIKDGLVRVAKYLGQ